MEMGLLTSAGSEGSGWESNCSTTASPGETRPIIEVGCRGLTAPKKVTLVHTEISGIGNDSGERWTWDEEQQEPAVLSSSRADSEETWRDPNNRRKADVPCPP
ncbi:hypothetical protein AV530_004845 [Patagioenas fasciata monilis]|uniref:Uncharacterized protein n=1 Tax=Patagioenas fasciata monilis TaxID=372326 RepID=A0A1V4KFT5_PATFA|nr:hypothetical protein AV530_004845 [Patagioenas fasciata monilis]